jgi:hypothetical protein
MSNVFVCGCGEVVLASKKIEELVNSMYVDGKPKTIEQMKILLAREELVLNLATKIELVTVGMEGWMRKNLESGKLHLQEMEKVESEKEIRHE